MPHLLATSASHRSGLEARARDRLKLGSTSGSDEEMDISEPRELEAGLSVAMPRAIASRCSSAIDDASCVCGGGGGEGQHREGWYRSVECRGVSRG